MGGDLRNGTELIFQRPDGDDVTIFLRALKKMANAQGRQGDNDWLVNTFETCLAGSALRRYSLFDDDIQLDFKRL
ncbi:hypothetical protein FRB94_005067 [Tulasnella sp. JGI-2019a]|nr:hypothetical protein FRB94_005067 [Tulasnella sp. JGI-2019a]